MGALTLESFKEAVRAELQKRGLDLVSLEPADHRIWRVCATGRDGIRRYQWRPPVGGGPFRVPKNVASLVDYVVRAYQEGESIAHFQAVRAEREALTFFVRWLYEQGRISQEGCEKLLGEGGGIEDYLGIDRTALARELIAREGSRDL